MRPESWTRTLALGIAFGAAFKFLMKAIVMPLLGADPINQAFHYLAGNTAALPAALYAMIVGAGFGGETVLRGYVFERFGKLFGPGVWAKPFIRMGASTSRTGDDGPDALVVASALNRWRGSAGEDVKAETR